MSVVYPRRLIFVYIQGQDDVHSKSDLCSCEATLAVAKKAQKKSWSLWFFSGLSL